ncbi:MAG: hypothetical protein HYY18_18790 [Planctomycetes bacterium]|nr:hypothetical protein [Planctomycetota bacterium]
MYRVWVMMAAALMGFYGIVAWLGFRADLGSAKHHIASAFFLVVTILFVHSLCMFYMIGSGRAVREAIEDREWCGPWLRRIRAMRLKCFPWALLSMAAGVMAAWVGAGAHTGVVSTMTHRVTAILSLAVNLFACVVEYAQLRANSWMIAELNEKLKAAEPGKVAGNG